jgi:hypothetical protein
LHTKVVFSPPKSEKKDQNRSPLGLLISLLTAVEDPTVHDMHREISSWLQGKILRDF